MTQATTTDYGRNGTKLDATVSSRLGAVAKRLRWCLLIEGLAYLVIFLLAACALDLLIDYSVRGVRWSIRFAMLVSIIGGTIWVAWRRIVVPLRLRFGDAEVANLVERHHPRLGSLLISAVRFSQGDIGPEARNSRNLADSVIMQAAREVDQLDFHTVIDVKNAKRSGFVLVSAMLVVLLSIGLMPTTMGLWFTRNVLLQEVEWPKHTHLIVDLDGDELIGARGDDLVIEAHAEGVQPRAVDISFETVSGKQGRESMVTVGREGEYTYRYVFKNAREDFTFYLRGGDDRTVVYRARLLDRPQVTVSQMLIVPPAYTQLESIHLGDGQRAAQLLPGSKVTIRIQTNKLVVRAALMAGQDKISDAHLEGDEWIATVSPRETHTYHFYLLDEVNLENKKPVRFSLRVIKDDAPRVRMLLTGAGDMITPEAILPIQLEFADTYGLASVELSYRVSREGEMEGSIALEDFHPQAKTFTTSLHWPVSERALIPGEILTLFARARDFDDVLGPNTTQTPEVTLRVVTREELLSELSRREQEYRMSFERLVDSQEQLRGKLLTALGRFQHGVEGEALSVDLAPLERRQRSVAGSVNVIRQQFQQNLAEMHINQLDTPDERKRLEDGVIDPLTQLSKRELVAAADAVRGWSRESSQENASAIDPQQVAILSLMQEVLANMIQWEGYQEIVTMLRDIIRLQQELKAETQSALEKEASDVFDN